MVKPGTISLGVRERRLRRYLFYGMIGWGVVFVIGLVISVYEGNSSTSSWEFWLGPAILFASLAASGVLAVYSRRYDRSLAEGTTKDDPDLSKPFS